MVSNGDKINIVMSTGTAISVLRYASSNYIVLQGQALKKPSDTVYHFQSRFEKMNIVFVSFLNVKIAKRYRVIFRYSPGNLIKEL